MNCSPKRELYGIELQMMAPNPTARPLSCTQAADLCRAAVSFAQTAFPSCEHILSQRSVQALVSYAKEMFE